MSAATATTRDGDGFTELDHQKRAAGIPFDTNCHKWSCIKAVPCDDEHAKKRARRHEELDAVAVAGGEQYTAERKRIADELDALVVQLAAKKQELDALNTNMARALKDKVTTAAYASLWLNIETLARESADEGRECVREYELHTGVPVAYSEMAGYLQRTLRAKTYSASQIADALSRHEETLRALQVSVHLDGDAVVLGKWW
jgi:hypothetical protein